MVQLSYLLVIICVDFIIVVEQQGNVLVVKLCLHAVRVCSYSCNNNVKLGVYIAILRFC